MRIITPILLILSISLSIAAGAEQPPKLDTDEERALYTYGVMLAFTLRGVELTSEEADQMMRGFRDQVLKGEPALDFEDQRAVVKAFVAERTAASAAKHSERSKALLEKMAAVPGATTSESGLVYLEKTAGEGRSAQITDTVTVHYHGTMADGTVFDSSRDRETPAVFALAQTIPCWQEAIPRMRVGGSASITCPSDIAYGIRGSGMKVPGGAALHFEVELIDVVE